MRHRGVGLAQVGSWTNLVEEGKPIVAAIYLYRSKVGLWPHALDDLIPMYLKENQVGQWRFKWQPQGWWSLTNYEGVPEFAVRFERRLPTEGWKLTDGVREVMLAVDQPGIDLPLPGPDELWDEVQADLNRRIARQPGMRVHYKGLISHLIRRKEYREALRVCEACLRTWPSHWWPTLMLATLESKAGASKGGDGRIRALACEYGDFIHWFFVAYNYSNRGKEVEADHALAQAAKSAMKDLDAKEETTGESLGTAVEAFAWWGAMMAYKGRHYDTALAVCDAWESHRKEKGYGDESFYAIKAACFLALGELACASTQLKLAEEACRMSNPWAGELDGLSDAIQRGDKHFSFSPSGYPGEFSPILPYE